MQWRSGLVLAAFFLIAGPAAPLTAGGAVSSLVYELRQGSFLLDGCLDCDRDLVLRPLGGTFRLTHVYVGDVVEGFEISDLVLKTADGEYAVLGSGEYRAWLAAPRPTNQDLSLTLDINGRPGIDLQSGFASTSTPFPVIDVRASEDGLRDPSHVLTIRLVAAPRAQAVLYELEQGSILVDECLACGRAPITAPIEGRFLLGRLASEYPFAPYPPAAVYRVDRLDIRSAAPDLVYLLEGSGTLLRGDDVPTSQEMLLELAVNGASGRLLGGGAVSNPPPPFPALDLRLEETAPLIPLQILSLRLIAKPAPAAAFRRGDASADRVIDIADALAILFRLFAGGVELPCEKSADIDDSGAIEITDAVLLLQFLFLAGPPPEPPHDDCGPDGTPDPLSCVDGACP